MEQKMQELTLSSLTRVLREFERVAGMLRSDTTTVIGTNDPIEIVKHFDNLRAINKSIKVAREALQEIEDQLSTDTIPTLFLNRSLKTMNIEGVGRVTVSNRFSVSIIENKRDDAFDWLRDNEGGDLIKPTVNSQSLASFAKELMSAKGTDLPSEIFKVGTSPYTSITKG